MVAYSTIQMYLRRVGFKVRSPHTRQTDCRRMYSTYVEKDKYSMRKISLLTEEAIKRNTVVRPQLRFYLSSIVLVQDAQMSSHLIMESKIKTFRLPSPGIEPGPQGFSWKLRTLYPNRQTTRELGCDKTNKNDEYICDILQIIQCKENKKNENPKPETAFPFQLSLQSDPRSDLQIVHNVLASFLFSSFLFCCKLRYHIVSYRIITYRILYHIISYHIISYHIHSHHST